MSIRPAVQRMTAGRGSLHREMPQGAIVMNTQAELQQRLPSCATGHSLRAEQPRTWSGAHRYVLRRITSSTSDCSGAQLLLDALVEARDINDDALVRAAPDWLLLVVGLDLEYERATIDSDQFGRRVDAHSDRRGGEMADIEMDAETLMSIRKQVLDCRKGRCLDQIDHDGGGEYGHSPAADARCCVFRPDQQICRSLHSDLQMGQVDHGQLPGGVLARVAVARKVVLSQTP
jgi:hypothetical protein